MRDLAPDACLSVSFCDSLSTDLAETFERTPIALPPTNRLAFLSLRLGSCTANCDPMSLDELACELVDAAEHAEAGRHRLYRPEQLRSYAQRISAAREMIDTRPAGRHSLWELASGVAMSPFLFARVFRDLMGIPPHQYVVRVRLQRARALYDYLLATMRYDKTGTGWGRGDAEWACDSKRGNCTDFHSLFMSMARSQHIPSRR